MYLKKGVIAISFLLLLCLLAPLTFFHEAKALSTEYPNQSAAASAALNYQSQGYKVWIYPDPTSSNPNQWNCVWLPATDPSPTIPRGVTYYFYDAPAYPDAPPDPPFELSDQAPILALAAAVIALVGFTAYKRKYKKLPQK